MPAGVHGRRLEVALMSVRRARTIIAAAVERVKAKLTQRDAATVGCHGEQQQQQHQLT